jgi:hypothetical protein
MSAAITTGFLFILGAALGLFTLGVVLWLTTFLAMFLYYLFAEVGARVVRLVSR